MKVTWTIENVKKTTKDEECTRSTFKDDRGNYTVELENSRELVQDLDKFANYKGLM